MVSLFISVSFFPVMLFILIFYREQMSMKQNISIFPMYCFLFFNFLLGIFHAEIFIFNQVEFIRVFFYGFCVLNPSQQHCSHSKIIKEFSHIFFKY